MILVAPLFIIILWSVAYGGRQSCNRDLRRAEREPMLDGEDGSAARAGRRTRVHATLKHDSWIT